MKKQFLKLSLHRETLRNLDALDLVHAGGRRRPVGQPVVSKWRDLLLVLETLRRPLDRAAG